MAISQKVKKEYLALVAELNKHNDLYHNQDSPEISDQEYDRLFKKLLVFESEFPDIKAINSPSERVGSEPVSGLRPFNHRIPMLSLDNAFDDQDIEDFEKRFLNKLKRKEVFSYSCEPKIDGIAICLVYQNGTDYFRMAVGPLRPHYSCEHRLGFCFCSGQSLPRSYECSP